MTRNELYQIRRAWLQNHAPYRMVWWSEYDFKILKNIMYRRRSGRGQNTTYNEVIIMADTETSKKSKTIQGENHVCAWTISLRAFHMNLVTLYGTKPSQFATCVHRIMNAMEGEETIIYFHNLSYDYVFLRQFLFREFGYPEKQLNTKPHYPILLQWDCGLIIKDSLILAQRSLDKWAKDMDVEHKKASGKWDYDKIRNQKDKHFSADELEYIEHDTLAGCECLDKMMISLNKSLFSMPYTATGVPREQVQKRGKEHNAKQNFNKISSDYNTYIDLTYAYHGGYVHANRDLIDYTIKPSDFGYDHVICKDFASSYPFCMLAFKMPGERFLKRDDCSLKYIIDNCENYAYLFKLIATKVVLKDRNNPMPSLQFSKCLNSVNAVLDNGRILSADYVEIFLTDPDAEVIYNDYKFEKHICTCVQVALKEYLPRWFTDYVFECFRNKTMLKGGDPVDYSIAKSIVNSLYGLTVQKNIQENIVEDFETGEYILQASDPEEEYNKYINKPKTILPYFWGCWVTSYAFRNLKRLQACCDIPVYSDTDSCYGMGWNIDKVNDYNEHCKELLRANGYGPVIRNGREYWLGIAEQDGENDMYTEFKVMGAKRYCGRNLADGKLHITVAGVPKKGAECLDDDISKFTKGFVFPGTRTGKLLHTYYYDEMHIDNNGNETADSIDLSPCDYLLDSVTVVNWDALLFDEVEVQVYEEG